MMMLRRQCSCCLSFSGPSRLLVTQSNRSLHSTLILSQDPAPTPLPSTDWSQFKPVPPPQKAKPLPPSAPSSKPGISSGKRPSNPRGSNDRRTQNALRQGGLHGVDQLRASRRPPPSPRRKDQDLPPVSGFGLAGKGNHGASQRLVDRVKRIDETWPPRQLPPRNWESRSTRSADQESNGWPRGKGIQPSRSSADMEDDGDEVVVSQEDGVQGDGHSLPRKKQSLKQRFSRSFASSQDDEFEIDRSSRKGKNNETYKKQQGPSRAELAELQQRQQRKEERRLRNQKKTAERKVFIPSSLTVSRLAGILGLKWSRLIIRMTQLGMKEDQRRSDYILNSEDAVNIAIDFGYDPIIDDEAFFDILPDPDPKGIFLPLRPPIVTIMGHVDHGKTTLLDALRNTSVAAGEAGGITQHIGAFSVPLSALRGSKEDNETPSSSTITFLDTPGHAAFSEMRARGATVTDIVVLVVAADDGVMPQTKEVLNLVKDAGDDVGLVVAINKIDKHGVDIGKVKLALSAEGIHLEEDGGDVPSVRVSGLSRLGLDSLVETLSTLAEVRELHARNDGKAEGYVIESNVDLGLGPISTVLVTKGTLRTGSVIVAGHAYCRVRKLFDEKRQTVETAGPGTPVIVTGWRELPEAGDQLLESVNGEAEARKAVSNRIRAAEERKMLSDTEIINTKRLEDRMKHDLVEEEERAVKQAGGNLYLHRLEQAKQAATDAKLNVFKQLRLVIKADVSGTVEAVEGSLMGIGNKEAGVKIVHTGVGPISEFDLTFAEAADALVIGFNVDCSKTLQQQARQMGVEIHLESVIYRLIETVRSKTAALLPPLVETRVLGEASVAQVFEIKLKKKQSTKIAGCRVAHGTIKRNETVKVLRGADRKQIYEGTIETLKHLKKDVDEIRKGMDCGIAFEGFTDLRPGDEVVSFSKIEVPRTL